MATPKKEELALQLGRAAAEMRSHLSYLIQGKIRAYGPGISVEMLEVMACLWKKDGVNQQEIGILTVKDKSSITHLIHQLVKRSLVTRIADERDKRNRLIYLTPDGHGLRDRLYPWVMDIYKEALKEAPYAEVERCLSLLGKMNEQLQAMH